MNNEKQMAAAAAKFADRWQGKGYEKGQSQLFWPDLLANVFGVEDLPDFIRYEEQVKVDATNFIDAHIPSTRVLIEQKSIDKDLRAPIRQSDGQLLNPFQQAKRYVANMPLSQHPKWIVTCNFQEFLVYDMEQPNGEPESIMLSDLATDYYRLKFLVDAKSEHISREMEVSMQAGEIVGRIYDALLTQYDDNSPEALRWLNILCVRIVFCLYAEDAGIFSRDQFHDYLVKFDTEGMRQALLQLFQTLNTPKADRSRFLRDDLKAFPYTNGGLFAEEIEIPQFTDSLRQVLLHNASLDFDWSKISPTIFGAVFESTLNPETRRSGGMHYTSIENIHKVIDPLFLSDLRHEYEHILDEKVEHQRVRQLDAFQEKLASLTFLDPACGSGNFLTETYLSLRRLENDVIRARHHGQTFLGLEGNSPVKVSIQQFYGIEINDFAVTVATTALWISEAQMLSETERIIRHDIDFLPLKSYSNIREGNALRMDWDVIEIPADVPTIHAKNVHLIVEPEPMHASEPVTEYDEVNVVTRHIDGNIKATKQRYEVHFDYIMGNPPFIGYAYQTKEQKADLADVCPECGKNIDYVAGWYYKTARLMVNTNTRSALVSTNSITQGEQVAAIWKNLTEKYNIRIDFAHRTFCWDSEASIKAHVHCVVIGFSNCNSKPYNFKYIFDDSKQIEAQNISPYLVDAPTIFIDRKANPINDVPPFVRGCQPTDNGNFIFTNEEKNELLRHEPQAAQFIRPFMMGKDFIQRQPRYCLWLQGANPTELRRCPRVIERVERVREFRLKSSKSATRIKAETPTLFDEIREPKSNYIAFPTVSSEKRRYVPIDFLSQQIIPGNKIYFMEKATFFHFGVVTSNVHMAWMRAVCGRLKSDYNYSNTIVYNNFPWPTPTDEQKAKIEQTAQAILDARALFPDASLADLYDEVTMPPELRRAHQQNDRAVMEAYGFPVKSTFTESMCVAELFKMYQKLTK